MEQQLAIWVSSIEDQPGETKSIFRPDAEAVLSYIPTDKLRVSMQKVCADLAGVLDDIKAIGRFRLKEVQIQVEVSAEGGVQLIGTATLGGKGAITMTFVE